jgi:topoisomerase-4 subunit A
VKDSDKLIARYEKELKAIHHKIGHIVDHTISHFSNLKDEYGSLAELKAKTSYDEISTISDKRAVAASNAKLYVNYKDGYIGIGSAMKKEELVGDCSDFDLVIVFTADGLFQVVPVSDKMFVGKDILHVAVWRKGDTKSIYQAVYQDGKDGIIMVKRFNVTAITQEKKYDMTRGAEGSLLMYFSVSSAEAKAETLFIELEPKKGLKKKEFEFDLNSLAVKGRDSQGNILSRNPLKKISKR